MAGGSLSGPRGAQGTSHATRWLNSSASRSPEDCVKQVPCEHFGASPS